MTEDQKRRLSSVFGVLTLFVCLAIMVGLVIKDRHEHRCYVHTSGAAVCFTDAPSMTIDEPGWTEELP